MNDKQLNQCIINIATGSRKDLKDLYDAFDRVVFLYALSIVKDYHLAEDVMQETFLSIMKYASSYQNKSKPKAWIFTIAKNACLQALEKSHSNELNNDGIETRFSYDEGLTKEGLNTIESLNILSTIERQIISLYIFGGFKQTEIARLLDIPYLTVRSKYSYAIRKLKQFYNLRRDDNDTQINCKDINM